MRMQIFITHQAEKQFGKVSKNKQQKLKDTFLLLTTDAFLGKPLKGQLGGCYSLRCWPYRIIYQIDAKKQQVIVLSIIHHQGAYK